MGKDRRMSHEAWCALIAEHSAIGGTVGDFCRERGLKDHSFYWHNRRMKRDAGKAGFRNVTLPVRTAIRVIVPDACMHIEVERGFDAQCLLEVVRAFR